MSYQKTPFGDLLRAHRNDKALTQMDVAKVIGTSDAYVRKLELGYTPPTFAICEKLAETLALTPSEKQLFLKLALEGRSKKNAAFQQEISRPVLTIPDNGFQTKGDVRFSCQYVISWYTREHRNILSDSARITIEKVVFDTISELKQPLHDLQVTENSVHLTVSLDPFTKVDDFVRGIQQLSSSTIRSQFPEIGSKMPSIWQEGYVVVTQSVKIEALEQTTSSLREA